MQNAFDLQLLFAVALVLLGVLAMGYHAWHTIRAVGFARDDFDRRAGWMALGAILGGCLLYVLQR
jgi:prolipoprotein diacylglyceryltransferase